MGKTMMMTSAIVEYTLPIHRHCYIIKNEHAIEVNKSDRLPKQLIFSCNFVVISLTTFNQIAEKIKE